MKLDILKAVAIGDFCGSSFEGVYKSKIPIDELNDDNMIYCKGYKKNHLTDNSVCTFAVASAIMTDTFNWKYWIKRFINTYPALGYGNYFYNWIKGLVDDANKSWGNGAVMRCSPIAWYSSSIEELDKLTEELCKLTHNTDIAIVASKTLNYAIYDAKKGADKEHIINIAYKAYPEWKNLTLDNYIEYFESKGDAINYNWYLRADNMTALCFKCFEQSKDFESAIKLAIQQGFDTDTAGTITASLAYAYYKSIPQKYIDIIDKVFTVEMELINDTFSSKFINV
ncbi:MAG: ADP-ribosylglycohydrolase family protein [Clostridia bacterium]|nr:ADP-ribosylglycohydrolase family protein [Clostridia bacterium]